MRILRFRSERGPVLGYLDGESIVPVGSTDGQATDRAVLELAAAANADPALRPAPCAEPVPLATARLLPPIGEPPSVRDFYAFERHVRTARFRRGLEMHPDWYELPVFYFSNPAAIIGPGDDVAIPPRSSELDYELEVACVVGQDAAEVTPATADGLVAGFTILNDWSARDLQRREMQLSLGPVKGKDFATSLGPWLVTTAEFAPAGLRTTPSATMVARVNGIEYSRANLDELWWSFAELLTYAAEATRLRAGDVIGSGTCGTGCILELSLVHGRDRFPWLVPGDQVELEVEGLGVLANRVVASAAPGFRPDASGRRPAHGA